MPTCSLPACDTRTKSGPYCEKHRARFRRHGDPNVVLKDHTPAAERWKTSYEVDPETGCWNWTKRGRAKNGGYGSISDGQSRTTIPAHKFVYEQLIGKIRQGFELDHTCNNPRCVNPDHLEQVTQSENQLRAAQRRRASPRPDDLHKQAQREYMQRRRAKLRERDDLCNYCGETKPTSDGKKLCQKCRDKKAEQYRRAVARPSPATLPTANGRKTHCIHGHEFTPENTIMTKAGRDCRTCQRRRIREHMRKRRAEEKRR